MQNTWNQFAVLCANETEPFPATVSTRDTYGTVIIVASAFDATSDTFIIAL